MACVNRAIILGNLGKDPELRNMPNGDPVCNFSIATSETWKDKQTGERKERTEWHNIVTYRGLAKIASEYLHKGSKVFIEGSIRTRKWEDKEGNDRYTTEIIAERLQMLDGKARAGGDGGGQKGRPDKSNDEQFQDDQDVPF